MTMESMLLGTLVFIVIGALVAFSLAAIVLRIAVSWYNQLKGGKAQTGSSTTPATAAPVDPIPNRPAPISVNDPNPYVATLAASIPAQIQGALPMPGFGKALLIVFLTWVIQFAVNFGMNTLLVGMGGKEIAQTLVGIGSIVSNFLVGAALIHSLLPTPRFGQACMVTLLQFVIYVLIGLVLGGVFFAIFYLSMPR